jgi:carbon monoxide dehydrogenase subunit G
MRFSDGPTVEVEIDVNAPPSKVWELVCDIGLPARFSTEFQGAEWIDGDGPAVGAAFRGRNELDGVGQWETTSVVVACEPERCFAWAVGDPDNAAATWRFELEPDGDGTRLRQSVRIGPGESGLTAVIARMPDKEERIIQRRQEGHRANMLLTVEGIKALAESS